MSYESFVHEAVNPWMKEEGPDADIVMSTRIRLARNLESYVFPIKASEDGAKKVLDEIYKSTTDRKENPAGALSLIKIDDLEPIQKRVLVEKHLISPALANESVKGGVLLNEKESVSIMINEEDHLRIQCLFPGFQLTEGLDHANRLDDWLEDKLDIAFDEKRGYLTSCPTNVGTGMRASVMMHLPALVLTNQLDRIIPAINQLGLVVRGIYGEGSEAVGNIFQISNQVTLGKSEDDIVEDLQSVAYQLIEQERAARKLLQEHSRIQLEDRVFRSLGTLENSRIIESKEAAKCLSDIRLGIDLGFISNVSRNILNELMILTQPGFLQTYAKSSLQPDERDIERATLIRERLKLESNNVS